MENDPWNIWSVFQVKFLDVMLFDFKRLMSFCKFSDFFLIYHRCGQSVAAGGGAENRWELS
jgi:hypothetical protein